RARQSVGRATPEGPQPRGTRHSGTPAHRGRHAYPGRGRASAPGREKAEAEGFVAVVARAGGDNAGSRSNLARLRKTLRPGAHLALTQAEHGMDDVAGSPSRTGRPVELAGRGRLHAAKVGARLCCGPEAAVGTPLRSGSTDACTGPPGSFVTFGGDGHASEGAETLRKIAREAKRQSLWPGRTLTRHPHRRL